MKFWMLILVLLLIHEAQGIRVITKGTPSDGHNIIYNTFHGISNDGVEEVILCKGYLCSGSGVRKLMASPISSTTTSAVKIQYDKNKNLSIDSSYPGILDIAGMDYSQARRKPPIHN